MRVLLVEPYDPSKGNFSFYAPSMGVWRVCGFLRSKGIDCKVFVPNIHSDAYSAMECLLHNFKPTVIGFSITSVTLPYDLSLIHWAKSKYPDAVYIGGGIGATFEYDVILSSSPVDYCVMGEGEIPMLGICESLLRKENVDKKIPGLVYRMGGRSVKNPNLALNYATFRAATFSIPYDETPISAYWEKLIATYDVYNLPVHKRGAYLQEIQSVRLMTTNYCPLRCSFCSYTNFLDFANNGCSTEVVRLTPDDIVEMIVKIVRFYPQTKTVIFQDDLFVHKQDNRPLAVCDKILRYKARGVIPSNLSFIASCRVDFMDTKYLESMKKAGFRLIGYGVESFSRSVLREYGKERTYHITKKVLDETLKAGIRPFIDIILASPNSELNNVVYTLKRCIEYIKKGCEISIYPTVIPFAGSKMAQDPDLLPLIRYKYINIPATKKRLKRGVNIQPKNKQLQDFLLKTDRDVGSRLLDFRRRYNVTHFPSRLRSLMFMLSAIDAYPNLFPRSKKIILTKISSMVGREKISYEA